MKPKSPGRIHFLFGIGSVIGWYALIAQLYLIIINRITPVPETIIRYFSFYTILTNILVALCFSVSLMKPQSYWGKFFTRPSTVTAITVYITVVGLVYNQILRFTWQPEGMQRLVDELLHSVIPVLFIIYWFLYLSKAGLKWSHAFRWLAYPFIYIVFILIRGSFSGFYPYPFIDVIALGYSKVFLNGLYLFITFLFISLVLIWVARMITRKSSTQSV